MHALWLISFRSCLPENRVTRIAPFPVDGIQRIMSAHKGRGCAQGSDLAAPGLRSTCSTVDGRMKLLEDHFRIDIRFVHLSPLARFQGTPPLGRRRHDRAL